MAGKTRAKFTPDRSHRMFEIIQLLRTARSPVIAQMPPIPVATLLVSQ